jgi:DNA recombination protein RmuC
MGVWCAVAVGGRCEGRPVEPMISVLMAVVALVLGLVLGWWLGQRDGSAASRAAAAQIEAAVAREAALARDVAAAQGEAKSSRERADNLQAQLTGQIRLDDLLKPLKDAVGNLSNQSAQAEVKRAESETAIKEQMQALRTHNESLLHETKRLAGALAKSGTRGQWGEAQLEMLLESAGLTKGREFRTQETRTSIDDPTLRPDAVVVLPGGGEVLIDAKFPFDRFIEACAAEDPAEQDRLFTAHTKDLLGHVKALAKRGYAQSPASPNFVVMFLPLESLLSSALEQEPTLLEQAFRENVVLATPTTMLALLRTIAYGWTQDMAAKNVREITDLGAELHERLLKLTEYISKLGQRIELTASAYNDMVGSLQSRVLVTARKIGEKSGRSERDLEAIESVSPVRATLKALPGVPEQTRDESIPAAEESGADS